jgi:hypothetical protein
MAEEQQEKGERESKVYIACTNLKTVEASTNLASGKADRISRIAITSIIYCSL